MVLTVRVVWPEFGDEQLQQLLREHPDDVWRVDEFPNFVTYRRQIEALKTVCIKGYLEPKPADIVQRILASLVSDQDVSGSYRQEFERERLNGEEAGGGQRKSNGHQRGVLSPAADDVPSGAESESVKAVSADFVLASDVVTDEAAPDNVEVSPRWPSDVEVSGAGGYQHLRQTPVSHNPQTQEENLAELHVNRRAHHSYRRIATRAGLNESQRQAVEAAVNEPLTIIQGPPGTGKTVTAAAIVKEWLSVDKTSKILVAAESNEAVNNLFRKICEAGIQREIVLRLGHMDKMPDSVQQWSFEEHYLAKANVKQRQHYDSKLAQEILDDFRIVCTTCSGAGSLPLKTYRFSRLLVDEAAQACETSCVVPLSRGARVVCLIGDHQQLPPLVKAVDAAQMKTSLFQRLHTSRGAFSCAGGVPFCMLDVQYRMHPAISEFPAEKFYEKRLKDGVSFHDRKRPKGILWPNLHKPIVFYNVTNGKEESGADGKSKLNRLEASLVVDLVHKFVNAKDVQQNDIGVITPYKAQKLHLEELMRERKLKVDIRTVDGFQGQEREVIVFSAVRANDDGHGWKQIGFLDDPHRMNVLLTRARRGLVVVGNRETLASDELWNSWIEYANRHKLIEDREDVDGMPAHRRGRGERTGHGYRGRGEERQRRGMPYRGSRARGRF